MKTEQDHTRHTSAERVEWLTKEELQPKDRQQLEDLDRQRVEAMRSLTQMKGMGAFKRVFDYAVASYVSSKCFGENSRESRQHEALDLAMIRQLLDDIETLHLKEGAITESYLERWRERENSKQLTPEVTP